MTDGLARAACRQAAGECFAAVQDFQGARGDCSPERTRARVLDALESLAQSLRSSGYGEQSRRDADFALVATVDERILASDRPERIEWLEAPIQLERYGEHAGGERFFDHLDRVRQAGDSILLELYLACLAFGFEGRYRLGRQSELERIKHELVDALGTATDDADNPSSDIPVIGTERPRRIDILPGRFMMVASALGIILVAWLSVSGLISFEQQRTLEAVESVESALRENNLDSMREDSP